MGRHLGYWQAGAGARRWSSIVFALLVSAPQLASPGHARVSGPAVLTSKRAKAHATRLAATAQVWDAHSGALKWSLDHGGMVMAVCFSEDSALLAAGVVMGKALLWNVETGQKTLEISVCKGPVFCVVLRRHAEQMLLATGDMAGNACIYDPFTGELQKKIACGSPVSARHAPCDDSSTRCHTCRPHSVAASQCGRLTVWRHPARNSHLVFRPKSGRCVGSI